MHLLAAVKTGSKVVLGQSVVNGATQEISAFAPLLDWIDTSSALAATDAPHKANT